MVRCTCFSVHCTLAQAASGPAVTLRTTHVVGFRPHSSQPGRTWIARRDLSK